jgi:hypothetical protein
LTAPLVVGSESDSGSTWQRTSLWTKVSGSWVRKKLGPYTGVNTNSELAGEAIKINDRCEVVYRYVSGNEVLGGLWQNGKVVNLTTRVAPNSGYTAFSPVDINNNGVILANTTITGGAKRAVLLMPVELITINTFIPQNNVDPVADASGGLLTGSEVFEGDDRSAGTPKRATWNKNGSHRTQQKFNVIPFQNMGDVDGLEDNAFTNDADGLKNDSWLNDTEITRKYDRVSSLDASGNLTTAARADTTLGDSHLKMAEGHASTSGMSVASTWHGERKIKVHCVMSAQNPLVSGSPAIDYDTTLTIDFTDTSDPRYSLEGEHDGFPAYEFYIGNKRIYQHDPLASGEGLLSLAAPMEHDVNENTSHINQPIPR